MGDFLPELRKLKKFIKAVSFVPKVIKFLFLEKVMNIHWFPGLWLIRILERLLTLSRAMTTQVYRDIGCRVNVMQNIMTSRMRDFVTMNPTRFFGSKVGEDPKLSFMRYI